MDSVPKTPEDVIHLFNETQSEDKDIGFGRIDQLVIRWVDSTREQTYKKNEHDLRAALNIYLTLQYKIRDAFVEMTHNPSVITFHLIISDNK